jgi:hypothetical protein
MGATVMMRDQPLDQMPPERFDPHTEYYRERLATTKAEIERLRSLDAGQIEAEAEADYQQAVARVTESNAKSDDLRIRYQSMLDRVKAWAPPTDQHAGLRDFMLQQLTESLNFDCGLLDMPERSINWIGERLVDLTRDVVSMEHHLADEIRRTDERNKWLADLRTSVPMPVK